MERFEIHDNQFIKKNVISSLPDIPDEINILLLNKWSSRIEDKKYKETIGENKNIDCRKADHYLCQYYCKVIIVKENNYDYRKLIVGFLNVGDVLYALTIADIILRVARKAQTIAKLEERKILTAFISNLDDCRYKIEHDNDLVQNVQRDGELDEQLNKLLDKARKAIYKELVYKIDGAIALAKEIGTDQFIQYAIDQSYFFEPRIVKDQMEYLAGKFMKTHGKGDFEGQNYDLYARFSTMDESGTGTYQQKEDDQATRKKKEHIEKEQDNSTENLNGNDGQDGNDVLDKGKKKKIRYYLFTELSSNFVKENETLKDYPIIRDNDGNAKVRSLITTKTGYTVSAGKDNIFQNYRISHVWGRAFDPRYFTNLWNIVIVPSWANDLLDKPNARQGTLESKLKSTIMKICEMLYFDEFSEKDNEGKTLWEKLKMPGSPQVINDGKDVVKPSNELKGVKPHKTIPDKGAQENDVPYLINVIEGKKGNKRNELGDIVKYAVYI